MILVKPVMKWEVIDDANKDVVLEVGDTVEIIAQVQHVEDNATSYFKDETHRGRINYLSTNHIAITCKGYHIEFNKTNIHDIKKLD